MLSISRNLWLHAYVPVSPSFSPFLCCPSHQLIFISALDASIPSQSLNFSCLSVTSSLCYFFLPLIFRSSSCMLYIYHTFVMFVAGQQSMPTDCTSASTTRPTQSCWPRQTHKQAQRSGAMCTSTLLLLLTPQQP